MNGDSFDVIAETFTIEEEIKKSRFITVLFPCSSEKDLKLALTNLKVEYPDARHYCWAYVAAEPGNLFKCGSTDDGEPSGSAGRPMLSVLHGSSLGEIGVVVIRYFGGTKLGVGGLVRAYTAGIKRALPQLSIRIKQLRDSTSLVCDYQQLPDLEYLLSKYDCLIENKTFAAQVELSIAVPISKKAELIQSISTLTQGQLLLQFVK
ncbi:YigZ family protein [Shewanella sp. 202IG2-18]|uniref:YigZ family protein n=1 Tax=Parashewanella hymeniacidonis TaxID=2807618 RepID=UPI0019620FCA|nr:YigZ family protein [Parashewanella hymeniacidonis]MBM7071077.1 YigZ family protein [Parashewanella hymeniacidonis]